ncbi:MAG: hypothetical protein AB1847_12975 [bacterium]
MQIIRWLRKSMALFNSFFESDYHDSGDHDLLIPRRGFGRAAVFLALLDVNLGNVLSFWGNPAARIISCFLGLVFTASLLRTGWRLRKRSFWPDSILAALSFAWILLFLNSKELGFIGLICALGCLAALALGEEGQGQISVFISAAGLLALFDYGYSHIALVWYAVKQVNQLLMNIIAAVLRRPMPFGHHASGFFTLIPFFFYFFALALYKITREKKSTRTLTGEKKSIRTLTDSLIFFPLALISQAVYLLVHQAVFSRLQLRIYQDTFLLTPFETQWFAFLLFLIPLYLVWRRTPCAGTAPHTVLHHNGRKGAAARGLQLWPGLILLILFLLIAHDRWSVLHLQPPYGKTVLIYDNLDWSCPEFGSYGDKSGGMFGNLPGFLTSLGYGVSVSREISGEKLEGVDCLVIINLMERFDGPIIEAIHRFIGAGGSLLIMGDHTGYGFIREPFNDILKPVSISFQFDSARSLVPSWQDCMEIRPHPITEHAVTENDIQIWTGASLAVCPPARPILVGKRAFSDAGRRENGRDGFLGDLEYQKSEWLGDVVLAAEARLGEGKILVFGDTSSLQNGSLPYDRRFAQDIFQWLTSEEGKKVRDSRPPWHVFLPLLWFFFLLSLVLAWCTHPFAATFWLVAGLYLLTPLRFFHRPDYPPREGGKTKIAYIDNSHGEFFDLTGWQKNSLDGLAYNLMRNRYSPYITKKLDPALLNQAKLWIFISPTRSFSPKEKEELHRFMNQGGIILWSAGWAVREASTSFLGDLGLSLENIPLGPVKKRYGGYEVQFQDAWPVHVDEQDRKSTVILQKGGYPLVVFQKHGQGGILLISDSRFLLNQNLEDMNNFYREGNIFFLRDIVKKSREGG